MGCDGGTIPKRDELVRQKKKPEAKDKNAANMAKWRHCALKYVTLERPIVVDAHGQLYNKDSILEFLLDRMKFEHGPSYVKKMKDVKELQLTENPSFKPNHNDLGNAYLDVYLSPYICPLTGLEMNGKYKFCAIWTCGCVMSDRALRAVNEHHHAADKFSCPKCGQDYSSMDDIIVLNPEEEDMKLMEARRERLAAANPKKNGSNKRRSPEAEEEPLGKKSKSGKSAISHPHPQRKCLLFLESDGKEDTPSSSSSTATAVVTKASKSKDQESKVVPVPRLPADKTAIQEDPTTTHLYKSLFTTSAASKEKDKHKAHWVTYNPLYF